MDSNACRAREVERKVWRDNDSLLRSLLLKTPQLVIGRFRCVNPVKARGSGAVSLALEQLSSEVADDAPPIAYCRASLKARRRGVTAVSVRRRFTASSFRFWGSATSGRLGRVTVLPQLKVDRLCSVVDGTAGFDPQETCREEISPDHVVGGRLQREWHGQV